MDKFMDQAIALAREGVARGDGGPFGAVVVKDGEVIGWGWNRVVSDNDPTAHAEVVAIRDAARRIHTFKLTGCQIYTSCEPCPMCLSAAYWARVERITYAASAADAAEFGFEDHFLHEELKRPAAERQISMEQSMRDAALEVFRLWNQSELKREY